MVELKKKLKIKDIFYDFITKYPKEFSSLFIFLVIEGFIAAVALLAVLPMADYLIDSNLVRISKVTFYTIKLFNFFSLKPSFINFGMLFVFCRLLQGSLEVIIRYSILKIKYTVVRGLFNESLKSFFNAHWGFFSSEDNGKILNTLNKEMDMIGDTLGHLATLFAQMVQLCIYLFVPIWLNPQMTLTALAITLLCGLPFLLLNKFSYRLGKKNNETANISMQILNEMLQASKLILGYGRQEHARNRYLKSFDDHIKYAQKSQTISTAIPKFFVPFAIMSAVFAMSIEIHKKTFLVSELAAVLWSLLAALPIIATLLQSRITINNFLPSYEQLNFLKIKSQNLKEIEGDKLFTNLKHDIAISNLSFTYPNRKKIFDNFNLEIKKGEMTAIVGPSGSGKSTIIDLLLGLQIPIIGEILIDKIPLSSLKQNSFREKIGYVPQDPLLFHTSIRENLLWSNGNASESDIWASLSLSNAKEFIDLLPNGLDTIVGDRGVLLSGGQRQRIALARALIRNPELLILDEATSSLDSESEVLIQKAIENLIQNTTILVIAHRLSTISKANKIYVLNTGRIIEQGSFSELVNKENSFLNKMLLKQKGE